MTLPSAGPDAEPRSPGPEGGGSSGVGEVAVPESGVSGGQRAYLVLGVLLFAALCAAPVALCVWGAGVLIGSVGLADALERTRGLAPTTYGGAFWLALVFTAVMAVLEVRAIARGTKGREPGVVSKLLTRPSTGLLVLIMPTIVLVRIDLKGTDVPDVLTTTALLCCLGYVYFILPVALVASSWRLTRWMWRVGQRSGFASGIVGTLGLAFASCAPLVCATADEGDVPPAAFVSFKAAFDEAEGKDAVDGSRAFLGALAEVSPNEAPLWDGGSGSKELFDECVERLFAGGFGSERSRKVSSLRGLGMDYGSAEDVVQQAIVEVCLQHARKPHEDLVRRFHKRVNDRRINEWRRANVRSACEFAVASAYYSGGGEVTVESSTFDRVFCALDERDQEILRLSADNHDSEAIGRMLKMKPEAVRQRKRRALKALREKLQ